MAEEKRGRLRICTAAETKDGEAGKDRHACVCEVWREDGVLRLSWPDTREGQRDRIELTFRDGSAEMRRSGATRGHLLFEPGKALPGEYETPWGIMDFEVYTHGVRVTQTGSGGSAELRYELRNGGQTVRAARMELEWRC